MEEEKEGETALALHPRSVIKDVRKVPNLPSIPVYSSLKKVK